MTVSADFVTKQFELFKEAMLATVRTEIKSGLENELKSFREEMQTKFDNWTKKQDTDQELRLKEIQVLHRQVEIDLEAKILEQQKNHEELTKKYEELLTRFINMEDRSRKTNIVISGLKINDEISCKENVENMFVNHLNIPRDTVEGFLYRNIHYLGSVKPNKSRSVIVAFLRQTDRDLVFNAANYLKGSDISMRGNYSSETAAIKNDLMLKRKGLINSGYKARLVEKNYKPCLQIQNDAGRWIKYEENAGNRDVVDAIDLQ